MNCNVCHGSVDAHRDGLACCPFCGKAGCYINESEEDYNHGFYAQCAECLTRQMVWATENDARGEWNRRASGWIACAERMPGHLDEALVATTDDQVFQAFLIKDGWNSRIRIYPLSFVTHWMPLPSPPEVKE